MTARDGNISRGEGLAEQAYIVLRDMILDHRLPPGTRLSVPEIASRLGVSRSPAREAITRIAYEGLAHNVPHKGAVVAKLDLADLVEIYEVREALEGIACRLAVERTSDQELSELAAILHDHENAVSVGEVDQHTELDAQFHRLLRRTTGNDRLTEALDRLQSQIRVAMYTTRRSPGGMKQAFAEHQTIYEAVASRDADAAEQAARAHIRRLRASLQDSIGTTRP